MVLHCIIISKTLWRLIRVCVQGAVSNLKNPSRPKPCILSETWISYDGMPQSTKRGWVFRSMTSCVLIFLHNPQINLLCLVYSVVYSSVL